MNTDNTDENILRYLKFIVISGDARTQKNCDGFSQRESLQRHSLDILLCKSYHFLLRAYIQIFSLEQVFAHMLIKILLIKAYRLF